jgi:hypothetical protein
VAHPLFRYKDPKLAGWKASSNGIVGLKMAVWLSQKKYAPPPPPPPPKKLPKRECEKKKIKKKKKNKKKIIKK